MGCFNDTANGHYVKKEMRIILLGIGGSGKSTFSKQMQIIHQGSFDQERALGYKSILLANILVGLKAIGSKAKELEESENYKKSRWIQTLDETQIDWDDTENDLLEKIKSLWKDEGIQETWKDIKDNVIIQMEYLMDNIDRFVQKDFVPTNDDILRARQRTTGESISRFEDPKTVWNLTDVGGQYSERTKWENIFTTNTPHAVIFFLALDEYNILNTELKTDECKTKFDLALTVFKEIMCGAGGPVVDYKLCRIVFLNKVDLFEEKIKDERKFMEFQEALGYNGDNQLESCTERVIQKLKDINDSRSGPHNEEVELKIHITNALDTQLMQKITSAIKVSIATSTFKDLGLLI